jgi:hypothetical protein
MKITIFHLVETVVKNEIVKKYLAPIEIISLRQSCTTFAKQLADVVDIHELIKEGLKNYVPDPEHFVRALRRSNAALANGSSTSPHCIGGYFLLQILLGKKVNVATSTTREEHNLVFANGEEIKSTINIKPSDLDVYGLDVDDGYYNRTHYSSFIHDAFQFKNKFYKRGEITLDKQNLQSLGEQFSGLVAECKDRVSQYTYDQVKDCLPISLHTGEKISREEWDDGYANGYQTLMIQRFPEDIVTDRSTNSTDNTADKSTNSANNTADAVMGNIFHIETLSEKLVTLSRDDNNKAYQSLYVCNQSYHARCNPLCKSLPGDDIDEEKKEEEKEKEKSNLRDATYMEGVIDYSIVRQPDSAGTDADVDNTDNKYTRPQQFLKDSCDQDYTKIAYDGHRLYIYDQDSILKKECVVNVDNLLGRMCNKRQILTVEDMEKEENKKMIEMFYYRLLTRQLKYLNRGFAVWLDFGSVTTKDDMRDILEKLFTNDERKELRKSYSLDTFQKLVNNGYINFLEKV